MKSKVDKLAVDKIVPVPIDLSKLSDVVKNGVIKKDAYNAKIKNIEDNLPNITNLAYKTTLNPKANLASKSDIANFVCKIAFDNKLKNLNKKITSNKTKHVLVENEFQKIAVI